MKKLSKKEKEIMELYWKHGPMFVRELLEKYDDPKPHFNTLSTEVRQLVRAEFLSHKKYGNTFQYYPIITEKDYTKGGIANFVKDFFGGDAASAVSELVKHETLSNVELKKIIEIINQKRNS